MKLKNIIEEFLKAQNDETRATYKKKIYVFGEYLVEKKNATDANFVSILKGMEIKDFMESLEFYVKNKAQIDRIIKKCEEILMEYDESEESENAQDNSNSSKENKNILKEDAEEYDKEIHINKKHDKLFKEILSDKREAIKFINYYLNLNLAEDEIEKYEKEFRIGKFNNIKADIVYKTKMHLY